ncbi:MAG: transglycosylase domain-containing protein [Clostridia bacterium]|nr:transglycosylase domain-containing protein [Clostridia bacterium]
MGQNDNHETRVNWGMEVLHVLGIIGKILFKIFSYFMNILLTILLIGLVTGIIVCSVFAIYINNYLDLEIDPSTIVTANSDSTTSIYYMQYDSIEDRINRNGTPVEIEDQRLSYGENSIAVTYNQIPENLINAFISIEDKRFRSHNGVDWITTAQAVLNFVLPTGASAGGSTITQQLIKNVTGEDDVTIQRKVQEIFRALNLEKVKSKEEIITAYLNIIYLGCGCDGVQSAANYYFGKDVSELSLVECASLAAIVKNPSQYDPKYHDDNWVNSNGVEKKGNAYRRWIVLEQMKEEGYITQEECIAAQNEELVIVTHEEEENPVAEEGMSIFTYYTESLITQLQDDLMEKYGVSRKAASDMVYYSGYDIYIPMDPEVQDTLELVYENDDQYFPSTGPGLQPESAMVICDPYTGDVLGLVGGRGEKILNRGLNRATQATRPPGSSIKPISVYAPALDDGFITYGSVVDDTPFRFDRYLVSAATEWSSAIYAYDPYPTNLPVIYDGLTTINRAVTTSKNTVAMKVLDMISIDKSFDFLKNELHIDSLIDSQTKSNGEVLTDRGYAALALGQPNYGITVEEITAAYCMFQNNGLYNEPKLYLYVKDAEGNIVLENPDDPSIVISDETASIMTIMMEKVMNEGTGTGCTLRHTVDVAGKTGTTSADFDRYFVGYTPYYVGGVWTGYDMNQSLSAFGENPSLVVWDTVMTMLHQKYIDAAANGGEPLREFERAPGVIEVTYCRDSGLLPTDACMNDPRGYARTEVGYFTRESAPKEYCDTHVWVDRCSVSGRVASKQCTSTYRTVLLRIEDRSYPMEIYIPDAQYAYRDLPSTVMPSTWYGVPFFANMLKSGEYCGSSYVNTPMNAFCYEHCDFRPWGGNAPSLVGNPTVSPEPVTPEPETPAPEPEETPLPEEPDDNNWSDDDTSTDDSSDDFWNNWEWDWNP